MTDPTPSSPGGGSRGAPRPTRGAGNPGPSPGRHWRDQGRLHREEGPAVEYDDGAKWWFRDGHFHRDDGPAVEDGGVRQHVLDGRVAREEFEADGRFVTHAIDKDGVLRVYVNGAQVMSVANTAGADPIPRRWPRPGGRPAPGGGRDD